MRPLYCDEGIWIPVARSAATGWMVYTARGEDKLGDPDRDHLQYALENDWLLLTFDDDFLSLVEGSGLDHAGICYIRQANRDIGDVVRAVDAHLQERSSSDRRISYL